MSDSQSRRRFDRQKQEQMDRLLEQHQNGLLSIEDAALLRSLVDEAERLMVENAKSIEAVTQGEHPHSSSAVPVTVWIKPSATPI